MLEKIGCILTAGGCALLCVAWAGRLQGRSRALHGWLRVLAVLETSPFCRADGMEEMIEAAWDAAGCRETEKTLEECLKIMRGNRLVPLEEAMASQRFDGLRSQDIAALRPVWRALEGAEAKMLQAMVQACRNTVMQLSREADEEMRRDRKLALTMCPLAAAAALLALV